MLCRNCGTDIADKALICFRCGTATTEAKFKAPAPPAPAAWWPRLLAIGVVLALVVLLAVAIGRC